MRAGTVRAGGSRGSCGAKGFIQGGGGGQGGLGGAGKVLKLCKSSVGRIVNATLLCCLACSLHVCYVSGRGHFQEDGIWGHCGCS